MSADDTASLLYLSIFGAVIGVSYLVANRRRMGQVAQQAAIWFLIFIGGVLVFGYWDKIEQAAVPRQSFVVGADGIAIDVPRRRDGHYALAVELNGAPVDFIIDTGATDLVLSQGDAQKAGIDVDSLRFLGEAYTANGTVRTATVMIDELVLGEIVDRNVPAVVTEGDLFQSLMGMSYLQHFGRIVIEDNRLQLIR